MGLNGPFYRAERPAGGRAGRFLSRLAFSVWISATIGCEVQVGGLPGQTGTPAVPVKLSPGDVQALHKQYTQERKAKDDSFRDLESPLADTYRTNFQGLIYYPIDLRYCFQGRIHRLPAGRQAKMAANDGEMRDAVHWGYFRFRLDTYTVCTLQVYRMADTDKEHQDSLFLLFTDSHAGKETYGGGRYLDLSEKPDGFYIVDFNRAYNPYCAYGKKYSCPIPPKENRLSVPIPAGERIFIRGEEPQ